LLLEKSGGYRIEKSAEDEKLLKFGAKASPSSKRKLIAKTTGTPYICHSGWGCDCFGAQVVDARFNRRVLYKQRTLMAFVDAWRAWLTPREQNVLVGKTQQI
jgi:hypothetical protein